MGQRCGHRQLGSSALLALRPRDYEGDETGDAEKCPEPEPADDVRRESPDLALTHRDDERGGRRPARRPHHVGARRRDAHAEHGSPDLARDREALLVRARAHHQVGTAPGLGGDLQVGWRVGRRGVLLVLDRRLRLVVEGVRAGLGHIDRRLGSLLAHHEAGVAVDGAARLDRAGGDQTDERGEPAEDQQRSDDVPDPSGAELARSGVGGR